MNYLDELIKKRNKFLGPNLPTFYDVPVHLVKGKDVWVWDKDGKKYLDCYNNVPHVGHCHPKVVEAITKQASTLNTHTRYLHEGIINYIDELSKTFQHDLTTAIMTCTGSEANDIALRIAHTITKSQGVISTNHTYHGNTALVSQLSNTNPYENYSSNYFKRVSAPDSYRMNGANTLEEYSNNFALEIENKILEFEDQGIGFAGIIICPFFANEGFPDLPYGWLKPAEKIIKKYNGIIIADEVQPGFGRLGNEMWSHDIIGLKPDIVTIGKPMANGHPVGAVITNYDYMAEFRENYRYFNTFGGNPVSCAASLSVLTILKEEKLLDNANLIGNYAINGLRELSKTHDIIGDIRGSGLFFGIELVTDKHNKTPAKDITSKIVNNMKDEGVLLSKLGINYNTLKIRPPMTFTKENADFLLEKLDKVLKKISYYD
jgi:4-aminobutyrate aminotransferase-like enzyme